MFKFKAKDIFSNFINQKSFALFNLNKFNHTFKIFGRKNNNIKNFSSIDLYTSEQNKGKNES